MLNALKERFPKRTWPLNEDAEKRAFQSLDLFLDILSGGNSSDFLERYLLSGRDVRGRSSGCVQRGDTYKQLMRSINHQPVFLRNVKSILMACREEQEGALTDPIINSIRINVLKIMIGVQQRSTLEEAGFPFSRQTWNKAREHNDEYGPDSLYIQNVELGHPEVPVFLREEIREHVMNDRYTYVLPQRSAVCEEARALTVNIERVYDEFPSKHLISYSKFRGLCSGKKCSATPTLRKWLHITDKCVLKEK